MTASTATADSVKLSIKDSTSQRFEFTFDSLELWSESKNLENKELRNSQAQPSSIPKFLSSGISHHAVIYGGKLTDNITRAMCQDSIRNKSSTNAQRSVVPCYRSSVIPYGIAIAIAILLFFFLKIRNKVLS